LRVRTWHNKIEGAVKIILVDVGPDGLVLGVYLLVYGENHHQESIQEDLKINVYQHQFQRT
jgi:S-ribosylhomocysteine lyase LuxS involved in autoinducer biosynthesis